MDTSDERGFLEAARIGDERAFSRLASIHGPGLREFCLFMLGCPDRTQEAVCETLLRGWRNVDGVTPTISARVWLYQLATNVCLEILDGTDELRGRQPFEL